MRLAPVLVERQLRAKSGRGQVVVAHYVFSEYAPQSFAFGAGRHPVGTLRWYERRRGRSWKPLTDWFTYPPQSKEDDHDRATRVRSRCGQSGRR